MTSIYRRHETGSEGDHCRSAAVAMRVEDFYAEGKRWWLRLHEKGGKRHEVPAHHTADEYLDAYLTAAGIASEAA
jgi:integrase